eukprot:GABV01000331.1.p1 GENE.GABV01000331.1~~GABV01000331.1.p1  ORF type:complete len:314 (-),score=157.27 GABV01000331.1:20-961(-)
MSGFSFGGMPPPPPQGRQQQQQQQQRQRKRQKISTNMVSVDLSTLAAAAEKIVTGDPIVCKNRECRVVFSEPSLRWYFTKEKLDALKAQAENPAAEGDAAPAVAEGGDQKKDESPSSSDLPPLTDEQKTNLMAKTGSLDEGEAVWLCEFCGTMNQIDEIEEEERPQGASLDYVLEPPKNLGDAKEDESILVFVVDTSGSMTVSQQVQGKFKLKGGAAAAQDEWAELQRQFGDGSQQFFPGQSRNVTWVSRLQAVQAAVDAQLEHLAKECPNQNLPHHFQQRSRSLWRWHQTARHRCRRQTSKSRSTSSHWRIL